MRSAHDRILTIGAVAVYYDNNIAIIDDNFFYLTLDQFDWMVDTEWFSTVLDPSSTLSWWLKQSPEAQYAAWQHTKNGEVETHSEYTAATRFREWALSKRSLPETKPIFVANPATFDKPFIDELFHGQNIPNPFDYRTLCLRSMAFGQKKTEPWGTQIRSNKSLLPHHGLFDAYAEAQDLVDLLNDRDDTGYNDNLYWLDDPRHTTFADRLNSIKGKGWHGNH